MNDPAIEVKGLVKDYGTFRAVKGISFEVQKGEVFSMLGPNGAGKTTTVEILECLRTKTEGEVRILGMDLVKDVRKIKAAIGVLPQDFNSFDLLTVRENIEFFGDMYEKRLSPDDLIAAVDLGEKRDVYFKNLSGGLKQRVGVAIAMVNDPDIVFLDEPTTGLDPSARRDVWKVVQSLKARGKTVILTTHYMEEAEVLSDRVAIIDHGVIIALGTPREIIEQHGSGNWCIIHGANQACCDVLSHQWPSFCQEAGLVKIKLENKTALNEIIYTLDRSGCNYDSIEVTRPTLEDVFLKLTGKKLGEEVKKDG